MHVLLRGYTCLAPSSCSRRWFNSVPLRHDAAHRPQVSALKLAPPSTRGPLACVYGVLDGHGGDGASNFVSNHLHHLVRATCGPSTQDSFYLFIFSCPVLSSFRVVLVQMVITHSLRIGVVIRASVTRGRKVCAHTSARDGWELNKSTLV